MGRTCGTLETEELHMQSLGCENMDEREGLEVLAQDWVFKKWECGLSSTGSEHKRVVGCLELGNELPCSAKYDNF
jgi:hypothetical protein